MKLTTFILMIALAQVSAKGLAQKITLNTNNTPIEKVLQTITQQSGYEFLYDKKDFKDQNFTLKFTNVSIEDAIKQLIKGLPISYKIVKNNIVLSRKVPSFLDKITNIINARPIIGRVLNPEGWPLVGASIRIKGTKKVATTNEYGEFSIEANIGDLIQISYMGYKEMEFLLDSRASLENLNMELSDNPLDMVQIIAYGKTTQRLSTGNITTVTAKDLQKQPVDNVLLALQGRVTGLNIVQGSGLPGTGIKVQINGKNSITGGNDPLYVIDGVPYVSQLLPDLSNILNGGNAYGTRNQIGSSVGSPMSFINPENIESISILKDAEATAIYGSRAGNGAIIITTKKGTQGQLKLSANLQNGWGNVARYLDVMNTDQYLQMRREALRNDGLTPGALDYDINGRWDTTRNTNWQKELIGKTANYQTATVSASGGTFNTQYLVSGTYRRQTTVFPGDFSDRSGTIHLSLKTGTLNEKFQVQFTLMNMYDVNQLPVNDFTSSAVRLAPNAPKLYNDDGSINWELDAAGGVNFVNPVANIKTSFTKKTSNLLGNALLTYKLLPGLNVQSSFGYNRLQSDQTLLRPTESVNPDYLGANALNNRFQYNSINSWIIEPQLNYTKAFARHTISGLLGGALQQNNSNSQDFSGVGYSSDITLPNFGAAASITGNTLSAIYKYAAVFGKLNYNYDNKYIVDISARRDGSSRFGSANVFHNFGAAAIGWVFTEEDFIRKCAPFLSFGKLSASYGTSGNDQIGDYQFLTLYSNSLVDLPYQYDRGLRPSALPNPYLQWESIRKAYFNLKLGFLKDRILFNAGYARNRSSNQLLSYALPSIAGFTTITKNLPATVQNTSWEFLLETVNVTSKQFTWKSAFNLTIPRNKLVSFPDFESSGYARSYTIGSSINTMRAYNYVGVDPATGLYSFLAKDGKTTSTPASRTDRTEQIDLSPQYYGGFQNSLSYKGFELDFLVQFMKHVGGVNPFGNVPGAFMDGYGNQPAWVSNNRWQAPGQEGAAIQKYNSTFSLFGYQSTAETSQAVIGDASFIRLKNISLAYRLPDAIIKKSFLTSCQVSISAQNLLTFTNSQGMDPDTATTGGIYALPLLRVITAGVRMGF
jgi:TonB-linked SusC/RagA family outer membrane protein